MFDPNKPIIIETNVSDYIVKASILQKQVGKLKLVAFYLRKILPIEQNYKIHDKELLVVVVAFKQWKIYLEGVKYTMMVYLDY